MNKAKKYGLAELVWPASQLGAAVDRLAVDRIHDDLAPRGPAEGETVTGWLRGTASWLGIEADPVLLQHGKLESQLPAPGLIQIGSDEGRFLVLLSTGRRVRLLTPSMEERRLLRRDLVQLLQGPIEEQARESARQLVTEIGIAGRRAESACDCLVGETLRGRQIGCAWRFRPLPGATFSTQAKRASLPGLALLLAAVYVPKIMAWLALWWVLWEGGFRRTDPGWLIAFVLLLATNFPFRLMEPWFGGLFAVRSGWLLKRRLLAGASSLEPEEVRTEGTGRQLGRALEVSAAERMALDGGILVGSHALDLILVSPILFAGAGGFTHLALLAVWVAVGVLLTWRYWHSRRDWMESRLQLTDDLVEKMGGHATRLAQERPEELHEGEDAALVRYFAKSQSMDRNAALLGSLMSRGWIVLSLAVLGLAVIGGVSDTASLALGVGGTLFVGMSLGSLTNGLHSIADALIAIGKIWPLFAAGARESERGMGSEDVMSDTRLLDGRQIGFRYPGSDRWAVKGANPRIEHGERVLLEGPSGGGKSTLGALLLGLRQPSTGTLLLGGLDLATRGYDRWRGRIIAAPQFHENHVFLATFGFNLLLGRRWPPGPGDLEEAEAICRELGLGEVLERMPGGMNQMLGESGWQLSHGEKSRLYIARALLGNGDLLVLDESFAALDPKNLKQAMECVLRRAPSLLVIAHP